MIISLESQKVSPRKVYSFPRIDFKIRKINKIELPKIAILLPFNNRDFLSYIIALFIFSLLFSRGWSVFIPKGINVKQTSNFNITTINLPLTSVDIISQKIIKGFSARENDTYYTLENYHISEDLSAYALKYEISVNTILNVNNITDLRELKNYQSFKIPITNGFLHKISSLDTLERLAEKYNVMVKDIFRANGLSSENISTLSEIFIPGVDPETWGWKSNIGNFFIYPVRGLITKRYGLHLNNFTGLSSFFQGVNFKPVDNLSNNVSASKDGKVSLVGYSSNYGNYLYIDHPGEMRTLYAHMEHIDVHSGEKVKQGQTIGSVGSSGFIGAKRLFFSIMKRGETVDPENYLF